jgi:putative transposase
VLPLVSEWQNRPLHSVYPFLYLDGMVFKVRDNGRIMNRSAHIVLGINILGMKEILGIWIGETEGAKFWLGVLNEIRNRGVEDVFVASVDGLTGFGEAIRAVFPDTKVQQCIVHQVRNTLKYVAYKDRKRLATDLRSIYAAPTEDAGSAALQSVKDKWPKYAPYLKSWETKWDEISSFFEYPESIRRIMYTTNAIESVNRQFRKVTKTTSIFPHDEALLKLLWLAQRDIARSWTMTVHNWGEIVAQLAILWPEKIRL